MYRAVLDTNVFIASLVSEQGVPALLNRAWRRRDFVLVVSDYILREFERVARIKLDVTDDELRLVLENIQQVAEIMETVTVYSPNLDEDDWPVLGAAVAGAADFLVTGDKKILALGRFDNITIITPREFLDLLHQ